MSKFRKRPVEIEAFQWNPDNAPNWVSVPPDAAWFINAQIMRVVSPTKDGGCSIKTLEGTMRANPGDWIIRGVKGELYPCKPDIFAATYELIR